MTYHPAWYCWFAVASVVIIRQLLREYCRCTQNRSSTIRLEKFLETGKRTSSEWDHSSSPPFNGIAWAGWICRHYLFSAYHNACSLHHVPPTCSIDVSNSMEGQKLCYFWHTSNFLEIFLLWMSFTFDFFKIEKLTKKRTRSTWNLLKYQIIYTRNHIWSFYVFSKLKYDIFFFLNMEGKL